MYTEGFKDGNWIYVYENISIFTDRSNCSKTEN